MSFARFRDGSGGTWYHKRCAVRAPQREVPMGFRLDIWSDPFRGMPLRDGPQATPQGQRDREDQHTSTLCSWSLSGASHSLECARDARCGCETLGTWLRAGAVGTEVRAVRHTCADQ